MKCFIVNRISGTPLHYAAMEGHSSVVEVLIRSHADVNAVATIVSQCTCIATHV